MRPSHLLLALAAAYLLLISLKFRRVLDLAATDLADDPAAAAAFSSPSSADHLPPPGSASATSSAPFPVRPFWHRYDRVSLPDLASRNRSALDRMADDAWALGLTAWEDAATFAGDPWALLAAATSRASDAAKCPSAVSQRARGRVVFLPCGLCREIQCNKACPIFPQLEVLPVRLPGELLHGPLSVTQADAVLVG